MAGRPRTRAKRRNSNDSPREWFINTWSTKYDRQGQGYYLTGTRAQAKAKAQMLADEFLDYPNEGPHIVIVFDTTRSGESIRESEIPDFTVRPSKTRWAAKNKARKVADAYRERDWSTYTRLTRARR
jgi:hypothetical protein